MVEGTKNPAAGLKPRGKRRQVFAVLLVVLGLVAVVGVSWWLFSGDRPPQLKILKTIPLGGTGKWDYLCVDAEARRLYVPRTTTVQVVDLDSGVLAGTVANATSGNRVHGVALAPEQKLGFVTAGKDRCVKVFDLKTLKITATVKTNGIPDNIVYDPASKHVFANHQDGDITVIDPAALARTVTIPVKGRLESSVADGAGHLFVCVEDRHVVVQIDTMTNKPLADWTLGTAQGPTGLAIDTQRMRLYVGCLGGDQMVILDAKTGTILGTTPIGRDVDGVAFDPSLQFAVSANGDGTASVVKETATGKFETVQTVRTTSGAKTIAIDPTTHQFLLPCNVPDGKGGATFGIVVLGVKAAEK
jgi:DNA-binding beta-propeller fold protein YncE